MKSAQSLLLLIVVSLAVCGCDTLVTRRSLYKPKQPDGYWTRTLEDGTWDDRKPWPAGSTATKPTTTTTTTVTTTALP